MRRIFVDPEFISDDHVTLEGEGLRHAVDVLRLKKGDQFQVISGQKFLLTVELADIQKKRAMATITEKTPIPEAPKPLVNLAVSLPRFATFEWIVEKSVELGVSQIQPLLSEHSFVKKKTDITDSKLERWQKIIKSATEQSIRSDLLQILPALTLTEWSTGGTAPNRKSAEPCLFGYELATEPVRKVLETAHALNPDKIWALSGSEGGFSSTEVQSLLKLGYQPASLGPQILRAETACVALVSIIKYEFDLMRR